MIKKNKTNLRLILKSALTTALLILSTANTSFAGHKNYFVRTSIDYSGFGLLYEIITDDGNGGGDNSYEYEEERLNYNYSKVKHYGKICLDNNYDPSQKTNHLYINFNADRETPEKRAEQYKELEGTSDDSLVFSFPGLKNDKSGGYKATSNDYARASEVGDTLVTGLNQALLFIRNNANQDLVSNHSLHLVLGKLSYTSELNRLGKNGFSIVVGSNSTSTTFKLQRADLTDDVSKYLIPINGLDYDDYVKISVKNGSNGDAFSFFPWRMPKGYHEGQTLYKYVSSVYRDNAKEYENEYLTWGQFILQAMLNNDIKGTQEQDFASDAQTIIGQGLGSDLSRTISSTRSLLGLLPMSELVLNMGARPANYHFGVMSKDMHNIALAVYTLNLIIALLFVGFMIVKMLHQKMLSTTNVIAKTSLMEGIKDLAFVAVMLGFFAPLFEMLLELNFLIVRTFSYSSDFMASFSAMGTKTLSMESMAGFIVSTMFLSIDMYINFVYLVRAITVSFLFAIAPIMIVSYLWSPNQKNMVFSYFRELVGNIFMQSFHAITMTFFSAYNLNNMSSLEAIASAYCFIPITQLFRQLVIGNSGGFSEKIGGKLAGQIGTMTSGMQKAGLQAKQSKEMFTAQAKAQADIAKAEKNSGFWSGLGNAVTTVGTSVATGAVTGSVIPGLGTAGGAIAGGVTALGGLLINGLSSNGVEKATKTAMGELGSVQSNHADQTLGMGLAELGIGLGISSFDSAGDRMVQSGLSSIQSGATMKGQAESRMGEGGEYMGQASGDMKMAGAYQNLGYAVGNSIGKAYDTKVAEANKKDKMLKDMELRNEVSKEFNAKHANELEQEQYAKLIQQKEQQRRYKKEFSNEVEQDLYDDKVINHKATTRFESDYEIELNERAVEKIGQQAHQQIVANSQHKDVLEQAKLSNKAMDSRVQNQYNRTFENDIIKQQADEMAIKAKSTAEFNNKYSELDMKNRVENIARNKDANRIYESQNPSAVRQDNLKRYSDSQQAQADYERRNPHLVDKQGYDKYVKQQEYKKRYEAETTIQESENSGNDSAN